MNYVYLLWKDGELYDVFKTKELAEKWAILLTGNLSGWDIKKSILR